VDGVQDKAAVEAPDSGIVVNAGYRYGLGVHWSHRFGWVCSGCIDPSVGATRHLMNACANTSLISSPALPRAHPGGEAQLDQFGQAAGTHFVHDSGAVDLDRAGADRQVICNRLVG
jgi:hypothetical protein